MLILQLLLVTSLILGTCVASLASTRCLIPFLRRKKLGQSILAVGPSWHKSKEGTPTMGGAVFLAVIPLFAVLGSIVAEGTPNKKLIFILLFALSNGLIGLIDDGTKLKNKKNLGLLPWQKLVLQSIFVGGFLFLLSRFSEEALVLGLPLKETLTLSGIPLLLLLFVLLLGLVNCVNLSDGIDGLTASSALVIGVFFLFEGLLFGTPALFVLGAALIGTMLGFLAFNRHPAKIFMGDTGSLFLGGLIAGGAFLTPNLSVLPAYTLLFLAEGCSVILQVLVFKRTGKRLFRMAPLHHHLEKCGWGEWKIVLVFSFFTLCSCVLAHLLLL